MKLMFPIVALAVALSYTQPRAQLGETKIIPSDNATMTTAELSTATAARPSKPQQLTSPDQVPEGLAKSDWQSIRAAYEAGRHAFQPTSTGWQARNPGQQWTTVFDPARLPYPAA